MTDTVSQLQEKLQRQKHLIEASYALHTTLDLDELLGLILDAARRGVHAERGTVFLLSDDGDELWSRVLQGDENLTIRLPIGKGIAGTVAQTGEVINIVDAHEDDRFDASWDKKTGFRTRQMLCAPIRRRDGTIVGVFQLLNKDQGNFDDRDETFLESLSVHASLAIENARLHRSAIEKERQDREIALAQNVQRAFQPERADASMGFLFGAGMNELCEDASGDYYDFIELPSGRLGVVVGDVSGHGLGASLVMAQARSLLRAFAETKDSLAEVMNMLNDFLVRDMTSGNFMCMFMAVVHPETGTMEFINAGHPPGYLWRAASGTVEALDPTGRILGILPGTGFEDHEALTLEPGDTLLLYTDGATEAAAPGGEMFGYDRL
ncbi:MAG: SpoIIE family protein phosphatase, partial [Planctomycetota bacterium]|nr:SpoIIE family protein phosphatase [Planctomycetota bacterium]